MTAVYPGTFDPPTRAHFDLIARGATVFGSIIVAIGRNAGKQPLLDEAQRAALIADHFAGDDRVAVESFDGLVAPWCAARGARVILRGVRNGADLDYELPMAFANRRLSAGVETVLMLPTPELSYVSSSLIKEIVAGGGDVAPYLTDPVALALRAALGRQ